jgi:hypothetical protein
MRKYFNKKIIFASFIFFIVFSTTFTTKIKQVDAQWATFDGSNFVQNTITAANSTISSAASYSVQWKEFVLDGLATMFAKQIIRQITSSVVSWINSGFEGSPSFLQNPGAFFMDVADQITGEFLAKAGGPLTELCSPFSIDIRLALAFKYRPNVPRRYTCTLSKIIGNTKNAVENASINGFTAGDFKQGGWPAFVSLTTEPQNNIYGAYLQADSELSWRVANAQASQRDELSNGKGFLSWRDPKCKKAVNEYNASIDTSKNSEDSAIANYKARTPDATEDTVIALHNEGSLTPVRQSVNDCPIQTPGSTIASSLENHLGGPLRELELADEFNEIVNALFAQLATQVLQKGLAGSSSKGPDGKSYLDSTVEEFNSQNNTQLQSVRTELVKNIESGKKNVTEYKQYIDEALNLMIGVKDNYDIAKSCYETKISSLSASNQIRNNSLIQQAQFAIAEIDSKLKIDVSPKTTDLLAKALEADKKLKILNDLTKASEGKTLNDLNVPTSEYSKIVQNGGLVSLIDIQKAKEQLSTIKSESINLQQDSLRRKQMCQILN